MTLRSPTVAKYNAVLEYFKNKNIQFEIEKFLKDFPTSKVDGEVKEILIQKLKEIFPLKKIYYPIGKKIIKTGTKLNRTRILDKNENNLDIREYSKFSALGSPDPLKVNVRAGRFNRKQESKLYTAYSLEVAKKEVNLSLGDV